MTVQNVPQHKNEVVKVEDTKLSKNVCEIKQKFECFANRVRDFGEGG